MIEVLVNEEPVIIDIAEVATFAELITKVEKETLRPKDLVLTSLVLNDQVLDERLEQDFATFPVSRISSLSIKASRPSDLLLSALQDAEGMLGEISKVLDQVLTSFERGEDSSAFDLFVTVTDGLTWFGTVTQSISAVFPAASNDPSISESPFMKGCQQLSQCLNDILEAHQNHDRTTFVDLLEYELKPVLKDLGTMVSSFTNLLFSA